MNLIKINEIIHPNLVYPKLPRAGLGNMLLVWANAIVFAHINSIPIVCPNWAQIRIGPWLRGEKYKRFYGGYFCTKNYVSSLEFYISKLTKKYSVYCNPPLLPIERFLTKAETLQPKIFIFDRVPHWSDYFQGIKEYQYFVKEKLFSDIHPHLLKQILNIPAPAIALHVRLSDFRKVEEGEDFTKLGNTRTPIDWFIRVLNSVRATARSMVPATIFSDGYDTELQPLLELPCVTRSPKSSALNDLLTLSRSKILICSSGSTFSAWASYLGECTAIWHPAHFHAGVFSKSTSQIIFEGGYDPELGEMPYLLFQNIQNLL